MTHAQAPSIKEPMLGPQAKIVSPVTLRRMLAYARQTRQPKRDTVIVLLSVKAGLRACEIAALQWSMVMTDNGKMSDVIDIRDTIAKRGSGRRISYQGIANRIASDYLDRHGRVQWADLKNGLIPSLADYDR